MKDFIMSGRFVTPEYFKEKNPQTELRSDCDSVIVYPHCAYIQVLTSGLFYLNDKCSSKVLDEVELELFGKINVE
jgi:hypothetical protein